MPRKKVTWVLIGDGVQAQLYTYHAIPLRLTPLPAGRFRVGKARSPLEGEGKPRTAKVVSKLPHPVGHHSDAHQRREDKFVARVASAINKAVIDAKFDDLILVAPPRSLAAYRNQFDATTKAKIKLQIRSEWTKLGIKDVETHLAARLGR